MLREYLDDFWAQLEGPTGAIWSQYELNQREDISETWPGVKEDQEFRVLTCGELGQILYLLESVFAPL